MRPAETGIVLDPPTKTAPVGGALTVDATVVNTRIGGAPAPTGTFAFSADDRQLDSRTADAGKAQLDLRDYLRTATPGTHRVHAEFDGPMSVRSTEFFDLEVQRASTALAVDLSASSVTHGTTPQATVTVSTDGADVTPSGDVTLHRAGTLVGRGTLLPQGAPAGRATAAATVTVDAAALRGVGQHPITVRYDGADRFTPALATTTLTVTKRRSSVSGSYRVSRHRSGSASITVRSTGTVPHGTVRAYDGSRRLTTATLSTWRKGKITVRLPKLRKGTHRLRVLYSGTGEIAASASATRTVRLR